MSDPLAQIVGNDLLPHSEQISGSRFIIIEVIARRYKRRLSRIAKGREARKHALARIAKGDDLISFLARGFVKCG
jgi:hypothetical protein